MHRLQARALVRRDVGRAGERGRVVDVDVGGRDVEVAADDRAASPRSCAARAPPSRRGSASFSSNVARADLAAVDDVDARDAQRRRPGIGLDPARLVARGSRRGARATRSSMPRPVAREDRDAGPAARRCGGRPRSPRRAARRPGTGPARPSSPAAATTSGACFSSSSSTRGRRALQRVDVPGADRTAPPSTALPARRALLAERAHALAQVLGARSTPRAARPARARSSGSSSPCGGEQLADHALVAARASGALPAISPPSASAASSSALRLDDLVDEAPARSAVVGVDAAADEEQLARARRADRVDELAQAGVRVDEAELRRRHPEL